jgi:hypothetical protein
VQNPRGDRVDRVVGMFGGCCWPNPVTDPTRKKATAAAGCVSRCQQQRNHREIEGQMVCRAGDPPRNLLVRVAQRRPNGNDHDMIRIWHGANPASVLSVFAREDCCKRKASRRWRGPERKRDSKWRMKERNEDETKMEQIGGGSWRSWLWRWRWLCGAIGPLEL